jgi:hypothetical protein
MLACLKTISSVLGDSKTERMTSGLGHSWLWRFRGSKTNGQLVRDIGRLGAGVQTHKAGERCRETVFWQAPYADGVRGQQPSTRIVDQVIWVLLALAILALHWAS